MKAPKKGRWLALSLVFALVFALSMGMAFSAMAQTSVAPALQGGGNCLSGSGVVKHDSGGGHTFNADPGYIWVEAGLKAGTECYTTSSNGTIFVEGEACYSVSGLGTSTLTISQLQSSNVCKDISYTQGRQEAAPTNTPTDTPDLTETPTDVPPTETPTEGPSPTATETPTDVPPTETPTEGPSPTATETPEVSPTPDPTATPRPTKPPREEPPTGPGDFSAIAALWFLLSGGSFAGMGYGLKKVFFG